MLRGLSSRGEGKGGLSESTPKQVQASRKGKVKGNNSVGAQLSLCRDRNAKKKEAPGRTQLRPPVSEKIRRKGKEETTVEKRDSCRDNALDRIHRAGGKKKPKHQGQTETEANPIVHFRKGGEEKTV